jgi:ComF family protein
MTVQTSEKPTAPPGPAWLRALGNAAIDLLFPPRCVACRRLGAWLCPECLAAIETIAPPVCQRCGLPLPQAGGMCGRCTAEGSSLDGLRAYAYHSDPLRQAIHELKYADLQALAVPLGRLMADGWKALRPPEQDIDVIVPTPLHPKRERDRGYNQAALLARELGSHLQRPVAETTLARIKATAPQVELNAQERKANVREAFRCNDHRLAGKRVLLIDDVCTTGSTLEAAALALRRTNVSSVWAYTLARAR